MSIRSHSLHYEEFHAPLCSLKIDFQVIGLSEIKASVNVPIMSNINLPGYNFHHTVSQSTAGGVSIYVISDLTANKRDDLSVSKVDFETIWIEIDNARAKNILCCCAHRHPISDIAKFSQYLQETLCSIAVEDQIIHIMGDFNIDLLNYGNHSPTDDFINLLFSSQLISQTPAPHLLIISS